MAAHIRGNEYDIIFAGGGTAACVAAGRLAKADPNLSILLVERGKTGFDDPLMTNPGMMMANVAPETGVLYPYLANADDAVNGRQMIFSSANVLGGGSRVNLMMYTRASAVDYDCWETEGWYAKDLIPLSQRAETFHPSGPAYNKDVHGYSGPVHITHGPYSFKEGQDDLLAAASAQGIGEIPDLQDFESCNAFSRWARTVTPDGKRADTASAYLVPLIDSGNYPNLHILAETSVTRVVFEGTRASAVECEPTTNFPGAHADADADARPEPAQTIRARKWVVLSAGTFSTPSILERSGVGCADRLRRLGISLVADLPAVGEHYQDHYLCLYNYTTRLESHETIDALSFGQVALPDAIRDKNPVLGWSGIDIAAKLRPSDAEAASLGPAFQAAWDRDFRLAPSRPLMVLATLFGYLSDQLPEPADLRKRFLTMGLCNAYPNSSGNIHIVSRDPHVPAALNHGIFTSDLDVHAHVLFYKKQRELARRTNLVIAEHKPSHPAFPAGSPAAALYPEGDHEHDDAAAAGPRFRSAVERASLPPIKYSAADDAAIEAHVRSRVMGMWHSVGTVRMAPRERGGVVDPRLGVHGTTGLKVVDLSICPTIVGANTCNTAIIVGEKAADLLAADLGLVIS
ncbi:Alcohol oxidase [Escovopsis weberi]|uniref:Alcohol oxidase n=1 Tax=Escovopsis weberi TaxID=150374 RepID=A0A0M8N1G4_ESCWE|nr:Alcohol oxidase [Escovopsis weberi]